MPAPLADQFSICQYTFLILAVYFINEIYAKFLHRQWVEVLQLKIFKIQNKITGTVKKRIKKHSVPMRVHQDLPLFGWSNLTYLWCRGTTNKYFLQRFSGPMAAFGKVFCGFFRISLWNKQVMAQVCPYSQSQSFECAFCAEILCKYKLT